MAQITLRVVDHTPGSDDLVLRVQDQTFEYLLNSTAPEVRVSAFFEQNVDNVLSKYEELYVNEDCQAHYKITKVIPGSKTRSVRLPGDMREGEQLTVLVTRS
jgi:hypothetical protein